MSDGVNDLLKDLALRCNIKSEQILKKSKEFLATLNWHQKLNCSDTSKAVICLELASSLTATPLSRDEAIKYSGYNKKKYINTYNNISKLLNMNKIYSVKEISLLVGVSGAQDYAEKLLEKLKDTGVKNCDDFDHPMYPCAAVLIFCRENKIKLNLPKLIEISRVKKTELYKLVKSFEPLIKKKKDTNMTKTKKNKHFSIAPELEMKDSNERASRRRENTAAVMTESDYEEWKKKMLEE